VLASAAVRGQDLKGRMIVQTTPADTAPPRSRGAAARI